MRKNLKKNSFIQGTLIASFSLIFIKILGAIYVIPFYKIIGEDGGTLYSYAYNIYSLFLNISTAGIPVAMSMIISEYLALEMYDAKEKARKTGVKIITCLAIVSFLLTFFGAPYLAKFLLSSEGGGHSVSDVTLVIKAISFCLLIIPFLSVLKGYLQGHKYIAPTSFSQVLEQIVRIIIVLLGSYVVIKVMNKSVATGVAVALTGAFFGGLVAYIYLRIKVHNNKDAFPKSTKKDNVRTKTLVKKIFAYSIPIVMVAIIDNLYTLIDIRLIVRGLNMVGYDALSSETISGIVATWAPKICTIIIAIATALTTNIIPHVTSSFIKKDMAGVNYRINQALSTMLLITIPMCIILFFLSTESYSIFYGDSKYGSLILKFSSISHIFFGTWTVLNTSLQSMKKFKIIYLNSAIGLGCNALLDIPMIYLLDSLGLPAYIGTILATCIGYTISISIVIHYLKKDMNFKFDKTLDVLKRLVLPVLALMTMLILSKTFIHVNLNNRWMSLVSVLIHGIIGVIIYFLITYHNKALTDVLGEEFVNKILKKLKLVK